MLPQGLQDIVKGWPMIEANPATFIALVVVMRLSSG
jgi:hypothetical protein